MDDQFCSDSFVGPAPAGHLGSCENIGVRCHGPLFRQKRHAHECPVRAGSTKNMTQGALTGFTRMADDSPQAFTRTMSLSCPAKINLALSVAPPDDNGMHPIASWMIALAFGDTLTLDRSSTSKDSLNISYAADAPLPGVVDWPLEKDLAYRSHKLLEANAGKPLPTQSVLRKRIPTGAGLGGGSSDAAAMLVGLNVLFGLNLSQQKLCELSQSLGSDVAYLTAAMLGQTSAIVTGLGEIISASPLHEKLQPSLHVVLIFPGVACPTGPVYKAFDTHCISTSDEASSPPAVSSVEGLFEIQSPANLNEQLFNNLAEPACIVQPILREIQAQASKKAGRRVHVTGSGATLFTLADDAQHAKQLATDLTGLLNLPCLATHTI